MYVSDSQGSTLPGTGAADAGGEEEIAGVDDAAGCTIVTDWSVEVIGGWPDGTMYQLECERQSSLEHNILVVPKS